ncbi:MAG: VacJ family lipoprotein [Candidatus Protistobacter heckmanni]|nr:VacJ family lipoprotein [Candidatus Protistobacter heckmanni]
MALSGCAATGPGGTAPNPKDPLEPMNRTVFSFNETFDEYLAKPVAKGYRAVVPDPIRESVTNFFNNIGELFNIANNALQGKGVATLESTLRFVFNTVFGIGGLLDFSTAVGIPKHPEDFSQTLGVWGLKSGPYVVLPLLGPSSARDMVGTGVQIYGNPLTYVDPVSTRNTLVGTAFVDTRANLLDAGNLIDQAALDKYSFVRDAYLQRRQYLVYDGDPPAESAEPDAPADAKPQAAPAAAPAASPASAPSVAPATEGKPQAK